MSWKRCLWLVSFFVAINTVSGQIITVVNKADNAPIAQATIQEKESNRAAITDELGKAKLLGFSKTGTIIIRHPSFRTRQVKLSDLENMNFFIEMTEEVFEMDDVVVSANKWEQNKQEIPQRIAEYKPEHIALAEPATAADLLTMNGQVFVQKSQLGGGSPIIRGFSANSVLIVIDGVRMNNAIYRSGNLQNVITLDPNNLQEAEVVFGPGSVIYGSDALGGVMDFHTKTPSFSNDNQFFKGSGFVRYSSAAEAATGNLQFDITLPNFASFTSLTYSDFGDLRSGNNRTDKFPGFGKRLEYVERVNGEDRIIQNSNFNKQISSGYNQLNILQKLRFRLGKYSDLTYAFHHSTSSDIPRYDRLIERQNGTLKNAEWFYGPQDWQMHSLQTRIIYPTRFFDQMKMTTALQTISESRHDRRLNSDSLRNRTESVDVISMNLDFEKTYGSNDELYYGIEGIRNEVGSEANSRHIENNGEAAASTRYPDGGSDYISIAAYIGNKKRFSEHLILSSGVRYSYVKLKSRFEDKSFFNFPFDEISQKNGGLTGSLGLVYLPKPEWKLNLMVSNGFRAPNVDDIGKVFDSEPGTVIVPNGDLKPETSYNIEYGVSREINSNLKVDFVNYYSFLRNALVRRSFTFNGQSQIIYNGTLSNVFAEVNVGRAFIWGFSVNLAAEVYPGIKMKSSFTYTDGEDTVENLPLRHVTPYFGETSMTMVRKKLTSSLIFRYSGGIDFEDLAPSEQNKPHLYTTDGALAWATVNINNSYKVNDKLTVNMNIENLLDTHYRPYSSGISAPGFNVILSVRATF